MRWTVEDESVPCYRCNKRELYCHGKCGDYKKYELKRDAIRKERFKAVEQSNIIGDSFNRALKKVNR